MPNQMERFTQRSRRVLSLAQEEAERLQHSAIGTEHMLLGLMREDGGVAGHVLRGLGVEWGRLEELVKQLSPATQRDPHTRLDLSTGVKKVLELAVDEARSMGHHYIGTEHLLLGFVRTTEGVGIEVLKQLGISPEEVRQQTRRVLQESPNPQQTTTAPVQDLRSKVLRVKISPEGKSETEFTLTIGQLEELFRGTIDGLQRGSGNLLYEVKLGDTQITLSSDEASETGDSPKTETE